MNESNSKTPSSGIDITPYINDTATRAWFLRLIRNTVTHGSEPYEGIPSGEQLFGLYHLAQRHCILPIIAHALIEGKLLGGKKGDSLWQKLRDDAFLQYAGTDVLTHQIVSAFETNGIDYVLLKGAAVRSLYPEPWMRSSSDIDILVREDTVERAADILVSACGMEKQRREYHNITLIKPKSAVVELHFSVMENDRRMDPVLKEIWSHAVRVNDTHEYRLTPEFFAFHQLAHAAYHLDFKGCGIRPFLDIFLIRHAIPIDEAKLRSLCADSGLSVFARETDALIEYWFSDRAPAPSDTTAAFADYVLGNRLFGSRDRKVAAARVNNGAAKYAFGRLFASRNVLEQQYPALRGRPYLLPFYHAKRIGDALFKRKKFGSFVSELEKSGKLDKTAAETEDSIRRLLGLR